MTKKEKERIGRIMPKGIPRYIRCYDNEGETLDQYIVIFTGRWAGKQPRLSQHLSMSKYPYHPLGFGQHGDSDDGPIDALDGRWPPAVGRKNHLGTRIEFKDLPPDCRKLVLNNYKYYWTT